MTDRKAIVHRALEDRKSGDSIPLLAKSEPFRVLGAAGPVLSKDSSVRCQTQAAVLMTRPLA